MTGPDPDYLQLSQVTNLYDQLPDVVFFVKDAQGRYKAVNKTLVDRSGLGSSSELVGRRPSELFGPHLGSSYEEQDQSVVSTGMVINKRLELHLYANGSVGWCMTSKHPVFDGDGNVIGLMGISQDLRSPNMSRAEYDDVADAIDWAMQNLSSGIIVNQIVERSGISQFKLNLRFQKVFGLNLGQWLIKQRIDLAQNLLANSERPIVEIALATGYSDQSAFSRQFRRSTGLSPRKFRAIAGER